MQNEHPPKEVIYWNGAESAGRVVDALAHGRAVQLELSAELHDAALSRIVTDEDRDAEPVLEIRGGHELVTKLAAIDAFAPMGELIESVRDNDYRIAVTSAAPVIFIEPAQASGKARSRPVPTVPFRTPGTV